MFKDLIELAIFRHDPSKVTAMVAKQLANEALFEYFRGPPVLASGAQGTHLRSKAPNPC